MGINMTNPLELVKLKALMELTSGRPEIMVGLIDGPVAMNHSDLKDETIREVKGKSGVCAQASSAACMHGTFVAGILSSKRSSATPGICPKCTLLVRPIFAETIQMNVQMPSATPEELATAIIETIDAGARVLNMSVALAYPSTKGERELEEALDYAAKHEVIAVAASGNHSIIGSSAITRHPWVIPVVACDFQGRPLSLSNLGRSIGKKGLCAPGENITSLGAEGKPLTLGGTSVAAPFVTGAIALLWSVFPNATASEIKLSVTPLSTQRRTTIVPPLLDAWAAYQVMAKIHSQ
jgi:subtilisin family serine protease